MTEKNKHNYDLIPNVHVFLKDSSFEEYKNKLLKENKNLIKMAKTINESKLFKGQINSREDIIEMIQNLTYEEKKYCYTLFFPNLEKKDKYYIFYYLKKSIHDIDIENENLCQKVDEEMNKHLDIGSTFTNDEYQNFYDEENNLSKEDTKERTDKSKEVNEKIDKQKLKDIFLQSIKIYFKQDNNKDIISFDLESLLFNNNLEKILKYFTKNEYFKNWIYPINCDNDWYLPLPEWAYSITKFDVFFHTLIIYYELVTLLIYEYYIITGSILPKDSTIYMQHKNKINDIETESNTVIVKTNFEKNNKNNLHEKEKYKKEQVKKLEKKEKISSKQFPKKISRKYIDLTIRLKNIKKYINIYNKKLKPYKEKIIKKLKELCIEKLAYNYDIEFKDYGSNVTGLKLPTSDIDILIYYETKDKSIIDIIEFGLQLYQILETIKEKNKMTNLSILKILETKVPIVKLEYDISNEIDLNYREFFKKNGLTKIKIDISFTNNEEFCLIQEKVKQFIIKDLNNYTNLKSLVLIIKYYLNKYNLNCSYDGGLNSISVFFLAKHIIIIYEKENLSLEQLFSKFLDKYSKYDFTYGIDKNGNSITYSLYEKNKKFFILNDFVNEKNSNFASGCYHCIKIINFFKELNEICP